jgi:hypothetical protein
LPDNASASTTDLDTCVEIIVQAARVKAGHRVS